MCKICSFTRISEKEEQNQFASYLFGLLFFLFIYCHLVFLKKILGIFQNDY
jgi:hypothetical protein